MLLEFRDPTRGSSNHNLRTSQPILLTSVMAFHSWKDPSIWEARATATSAVDADAAMADNPARPKTFAELLKADLQLTADKKMRNVHYAELHELREARDNLDLEIEGTEAELEAADAFIRQKDVEKQVDVHALGLSNALLKAYGEFCESLYSQWGGCRGISIFCDQPHHGSYFGYDPEFCFFKQFTEEQEKEKMELRGRLEEVGERMREKGEDMGIEVEEEDGEEAPTDQGSDMEIAEAGEGEVGEGELDVKMKEHVHWTNRSFRCEASVSVVREFDGSERTEQIVEFWPLPQIEPQSGVEATWGEQYVSYLLSVHFQDRC
jgi:hypothetical protein